MKCGCLLLKRMMGNKRPKLKTLLYLSPYNVSVVGHRTSNVKGEEGFWEHWPEFRREELELCDGNITASIQAVDEPDYHSGHYAMLEIIYRCDKCNSQHFPELPDSGDALSEFMTKAIALMTEEQRGAIFAQKKVIVDAANAQREAMMKQIEADRQARAARKKK
jgi:hypothetical protein